jgi:[CysO sulfur-carrier protein]-S-L-cysteine hydrolase
MMIDLPAKLWKQLVTHSRKALPDEAVGLLAGTTGRITAAIPLPNIGPRGEFLADPHAQYMAERRIQREGMQLLAIYHSHPAGGTQLSPLDIKFAKERPCFHIVIALDPARPGHEVAVAYDLQPNKPRAVAIEIT